MTKKLTPLPQGQNWTIPNNEIALLRARVETLEAAILKALNELGVPQPGYPAPVTNAVGILLAALNAEAVTP